MINDFENNNELKKLKNNFQIDKECSILEVCLGRLYIAYEDSEFEFTNLEGYLSLVINRKHSCLFFYLFGFSTFKKDFEIELYTNIDKGYSILKDNFHSVEYPSFFLGINFSSKIDAEKMRNSIFFYSIILNSQLSLHSLKSSKKIESDAQRNSRLVSELNNFSNKPDLQKPQRIAEIYINNEDGNAYMDVNKEEFKNLNAIGLSAVSLENYYKKQLKGVSKQKLDKIFFGINRNENKFVDFDYTRKITIINEEPLRSSTRKTSLKMNNTYNVQMEIQQSNIKHFNHVQVDK